MVLRFVDQEPRVAKQDAKNAVRDPLDALIELITNSMDSYNRMKGRGEKIPPEIDGKIEIYLYKKTKGKERKAVIGCKDWAEGIAPDKVKEYISGYGARTSGKEKFQSVRGYFGRGLKDAVGGIDGIGYIYSVKDGVISYGFLDGRSKEGIKYNDDIKTYEANPQNLKKFRLTNDAKTIAIIEFPTQNIVVPNFSTFAEKLTLCVQLRPLMERGNIKLYQTEKGKVLRETTLKYNPPSGTRVLVESNDLIPGESATYDIEIYKANEPLSQGEEGKFREGGLLIMSGTTVHEATLLKFERDPNASKFFGWVRCDYIDELMRKDEAVVTPDRRGLNWEHPFMKKLKIEIEKKLQPLVDLEKKEREKRRSGISKDTLKRNETLGRKLGKLYKEIMKEELGLSTLGGEEASDEKEMLKPSGGFGFIPSYYRMECGKEQKIRLVIESPKTIPSYEKVSVESDNKEIVLEKESYLVSEGEYVDDKGVFILRIGVTGNKTGELGKITAKTLNKRGEECICTALVSIKEVVDYPPNGFSFVPPEYRIKIEKPSKLILKVDSALADNDMKIKVESNNKYIVVETPKLTIQKGRGVIEKYISVKGTRSGETGIITAVDVNVPTRKAEAKVKVISATKTSSPKGFEIEFDDTPYPIQRALCRGNTIYIFTKEPTVKMYFGERGEYDKTLSFQVLCADLITDAFCTKVVEDLGEKIVYPGEDRETAIQRKINQLKIKYGPIIHKTYVNQSLLSRERTEGSN